MDTYINVNYKKCIKCYKCIKLCTNKHEKFLGYLQIDTFDGTPDSWSDNPNCHRCSHEINNKIEYFPCNIICPTGAMEIKRC